MTMRLALLVTVSAAFVLLLPPAPVDAERPEFVLRLAVDKDKLTLAEEIPFKVTLSKKRGKAVQVNALRLARNSVSLRAKLES